jgi:hypothetical protein
MLFLMTIETTGSGKGDAIVPAALLRQLDGATDVICPLKAMHAVPELTICCMARVN